MGKEFGNLAFLRGIIYYKLSPHEQKPFAGAIRYGLPNFVPRTLATVVYWAPQFIVGYVVYKFSEDANWRSHRKNPKDYIDEVDPNPEPEPEPEKKKCA